MIGAILSILAGILISFQGVFNTRLSDKVGLWETTAVVHAVGLIFSLFVITIFAKGNISRISEVNKLYLLGGVFGVMIVFCVMKGITLLGPTLSVSLLIISQLVICTLIDTFGLFGSPQVKFDLTKLIGISIMIFGLVVFKLKG